MGMWDTLLDVVNNAKTRAVVCLSAAMGIAQSRAQSICTGPVSIQLEAASGESICPLTTDCFSQLFSMGNHWFNTFLQQFNTTLLPNQACKTYQEIVSADYGNSYCGSTLTIRSNPDISASEADDIGDHIKKLFDDCADVDPLTFLLITGIVIGGFLGLTCCGGVIATVSRNAIARRRRRHAAQAGAAPAAQPADLGAVGQPPNFGVEIVIGVGAGYDPLPGDEHDRGVIAIPGTPPLPNFSIELATL